MSATNAYLMCRSGPHDSLLLDVASGPPVKGGSLLSVISFVPDDIMQVWSGIIKEAESHKSGAVFLNVHQDVISHFFDSILKSGFQFHHHLNGIYTFYRWQKPNVEDKVPPFATSIGGVGVLLLSPDEQSVLMVYEYSKWKFVTGTVECNESILDAARREVKQEVGIMVADDAIFAPRWIGGYHGYGIRDSLINDNFHVVALKSSTWDIQPDGEEIKQAKWMPISLFQQIASQYPHELQVDVGGVIVHEQQVHGKRYVRWIAESWCGTNLSSSSNSLPNQVAQNHHEPPATTTCSLVRGKSCITDAKMRITFFF